LSRFNVSKDLDLKPIASQLEGKKEDQKTEKKEVYKNREAKKKILGQIKTLLQTKYRSLPEATSVTDKSSQLRFLFRKLRF
jgi:Ribosomal L27e protein family